MAHEEIKNKRLTQTLATLIKLFECPVCFERITPPVTTCINGHAVCQNCRKQLLSCPTCKAGFSLYKNTMLDQIIEENIFPCRFTDKGCQIELQFRDLEHHERKACKYRTVACAVQGPDPTDTCHTEISICRYYEHVLAAHGTEVIRFGQENHRILDISKPVSNIRILKDDKSAKVVFETVKLDKVLDKFYVTCQYVGEAEAANLHTYELRIYNRNQRHKELRYKNLCVPAGLSDEDLEKYETCLVLDAWILRGFTADERLFYSLTIDNVPRKWYQVVRDKCQVDKVFACGGHTD